MKHQKIKIYNILQLTEKIPAPRNAKEHYQSFIRKENAKSVKQSETITQKSKTLENSNTVDIKQHSETSYKLSKTTIQAQKVSQVGSNSSLYSDTKKSENFLNEKNMNITKRVQSFRGFTGFYNVKILNSFNLELQLKGTDSAIKNEVKNY